MLEPPVFILGSPRSGTTLLSHLLLSAGGFAVVRSELHALNIIGPRFGGLKSESDRAALVETWLATEVHRRTGLSSERLRELVMGEVRSATDFLGTVMEEVCAIQGARRWSDCTPENVAYIEPLALAFPEARFLHVVRDGRDVAASIAKRGLANAAARDEGRELEVAALLWEWFVKQGRRGCEAFRERSMEVRYEELVSDRGGSLERISAFIGHEVDPARVEEFALGSVSKPNTSFEEDLEKGSFQPVERWRRSAIFCFIICSCAGSGGGAAGAAAEVVGRGGGALELDACCCCCVPTFSELKYFSSSSYRRNFARCSSGSSSGGWPRRRATARATACCAPTPSSARSSTR